MYLIHTASCFSRNWCIFFLFQLQLLLGILTDSLFHNFWILLSNSCFLHFLNLIILSVYFQEWCHLLTVKFWKNYELVILQFSRKIYDRSGPKLRRDSAGLILDFEDVKYNPGEIENSLSPLSTGTRSLRFWWPFFNCFLKILFD